jgi:hypothetical protein
LGNFDHLLSQTFTKFSPVLPSILNKYQFNFDQLWANITSILTNFDQRLNHWGGGCYTPHTTPPHHTPPIATCLYSVQGKHLKMQMTSFPRSFVSLYSHGTRRIHTGQMKVMKPDKTARIPL